MIFTVGVVIVDREAFVDPRLDTLTPVVRDILSRTAHDHDSFVILTANVAPQSAEEISTVVKKLIARKSVDLILVVGGIGFEETDCTPEAVDSLIKRPCAALVNRILANVQDPFLIRPSAGVSDRAVIMTLPGDTEDLRRAATYLVTSAPGFIRLLNVLKNGTGTFGDVERSAPLGHSAALDEATPSDTSPNAGLAPPLSIPAQVTSETPWRCFEIRTGIDIIAPHLSRRAGSRPTTVPSVDIKYSSLVASPNGELYMSGGSPRPRGLFRLELDTRNSVATIRKVQAAGICPSPRYGHSAVWIGTSLMVVWGGHDTSPEGMSDTDVHVYNAITLTWKTLRTSGPSPSPRHSHGMVAISKTIYVHGGCSQSGTSLSDFWCLDFSAFSNPKRTQKLRWQNLSSTLSQCAQGDSPGPQFYHRLAVCGSDIILLGSSPRTTIKDAVYSYSTETSQWKKRCTPGLGTWSDSGAIHLGDTIYLHNEENCRMFDVSNNVWLGNPSTYSLDNLRGPMTSIDSKAYVLGISFSDDSKLALFELDPEKLWLPTQAEYDAARLEYDIARALRD